MHLQIIHIFLLKITLSLCELRNNFSTYNREERFFGVGIVRFENILCKSMDGFDGTCYTKRECRDIDGGQASGRCANNLGVCCVVRQTCGGRSAYNNTYFVNPSFPRTLAMAGTCSIVIEKCHSDICQIRIDFLTLSVAQPNYDGFCVYDSVRITGGASVIPPICGENSGQHIYLDFNGDSDITITISTSVSDAWLNSWLVKIAQIGCSSPSRAPSGCLMYYTDLTGTVNSFNFAKTKNENYPTTMTAGTREIANLNYGICIAMRPGYCSIEWGLASTGSFITSGDPTMDATVPCTSSTGLSCTNDFVTIPNANDCTTPTLLGYDRFCGCDFPAMICTSSKPFVLTVITNNAEQLDMNGLPPAAPQPSVANIGFALTFAQKRCPLVNSISK